MRVNPSHFAKKRNTTLLELEKIPKGYKKLEHQLSKKDQAKIIETLHTPELIRVSSKDEGTQGTSMKQGSERMVTYAFEEGDASFNSYSVGH